MVSGIVARWVGHLLSVASRSIAICVIRGLIAGFVSSHPLFGADALNWYLGQRGSRLTTIFLPESLQLRYACYAVLAICSDLLIFVLYIAGPWVRNMDLTAR